MKPILFALPFVSAHGYLEDPPGRNLIGTKGPDCLYPKGLEKDYNKHGIFREWPEGGSTGEINKRGKKDGSNDLKVHELGEACGAGIKDSKVPYNTFKVNQFGISKYVKPNSPAEVTVKLTAPKQGHVWFDFACFDGKTDKFSHDKSVSWKRLEHADGGSVSTTKSGVNELKVKLKMPGECGHGVLQWTWWAEHKNPVENFFNCADIKITNAAQPATLPCAGKGEEPPAGGGSPGAEGGGIPPDSGGESPPDSAGGGGNPPESAGGGENPPNSAGGGENPPDSAGGGGENINLVIGIVIAGVVVIALVGLFVYWKKSNNQSPDVPPPRPTNFQPGRRPNNKGNYQRRPRR